MDEKLSVTAVVMAKKKGLSMDYKTHTKFIKATLYSIFKAI